MTHARIVLFLLCLFLHETAYGLFLDEAQTLRFNSRVYNRMAMSLEGASENMRFQTPYNSFNLLQSRTFIQMDLRHNLIDYVEGRKE